MYIINESVMILSFFFLLLDLVFWFILCSLIIFLAAVGFYFVFYFPRVSPLCDYLLRPDCVHLCLIVCIKSCAPFCSCLVILSESLCVMPSLTSQAKCWSTIVVVFLDYSFARPWGFLIALVFDLALFQPAFARSFGAFPDTLCPDKTDISLQQKVTFWNNPVNNTHSVCFYIVK